MRIAIATSIATLFVTGCIFPSFDNMQNGSRSNGSDERETESSPSEVTAKQAEIGSDASPDASVVAAPVSTTPDASPDVAVAPPPGAGKIACGSSECTVGSDNYCCAGYGAPAFSCKNDNTFLAGACAGGDAHALFCDEKADCPTGQVCCDLPEGIGTAARCATTCSGKILCKTDDDCSNGKKCTGSLDSDVPNKVCQ